MKKAKKLEIAQLSPHGVLRKKADEITNFKSKELQELIENMIATMEEAVGIAAPQVYKSVRLIIVKSYPNSRYPEAPLMKKPMVMINPKIICQSKEMERNWEGCLSLPGIRAVVARPKTVTVEYFTREGKKQIKSFNDFIARIIKHEIDHLNGIVFTDRADPKDFIMEKVYMDIFGAKKKK